MVFTGTTVALATNNEATTLSQKRWFIGMELASLKHPEGGESA